MVVLDAVAALDLDAFYAAYRLDGRARPAYEPSMFIAVLLYAYRVLAAQQNPDHATLARFVERHQDALAEVKEAKRRPEEQLFTEMRAEQAYQRYRAKGKDRRGGRLGPNTVPKPYIAPPFRRHDQHHRSGLQPVKGQHGWLQGCNAQAAVNEQQIVITAEIEVVSPDFGHLERIVTAARGELEAVGITQRPGAIVADSGYWHPNRCNGSPPTASPF